MKIKDIIERLQTNQIDEICVSRESGLHPDTSFYSVTIRDIDNRCRIHVVGKEYENEMIMDERMYAIVMQLKHDILNQPTQNKE